MGANTVLSALGVLISAATTHRRRALVTNLKSEDDSVQTNRLCS